MNSPAKKSPYLLLLRQPAGGTPPPAELGKIMARFKIWVYGLAQKGMLQSTSGLELTGQVLHGRRTRDGRRVTDGPYVEAKEVVGGFLLITAANLKSAVAAARKCPGLDYAMTVEVRPVRRPR